MKGGWFQQREYAVEIRRQSHRAHLILSKGPSLSEVNTRSECNPLPSREGLQ